MGIVNIIAMIVLLIGGIAWGIFGIFSFNLVEFVCMKNRLATRIVYILVLIASIWLIFSWILNGAILFLI